MKIDQQRNFEIRSFQTVNALCQMLGGEIFYALEFDDDLILNQQIGHILAHDPAFAGHA